MRRRTLEEVREARGRPVKKVKIRASRIVGFKGNRISEGRVTEKKCGRGEVEKGQ